MQTVTVRVGRSQEIAEAIAKAARNLSVYVNLVKTQQDASAGHG